MSTLILNLTKTRPAADRSPLGMRDVARVLVMLAMLLSGIVFTEPAPVDLIIMGLIGLLPLVGLQRYTPALALYLMLWLVCGAGALLASAMSEDWQRSATHAGVSIYLYAASFAIAAFVAHTPRAHTELIFRAWIAGALVAASAALIGYFGLLPGSYELFTKFGRAAGTFKDPNVLGPFLAPAVLYCLLIAIGGTFWRAQIPLAIAAFLSLALLLSFSRGAWINMGVAVAVFGYALLVTTHDARTRRRMLLLGSAGLLALAAVIVAALQIDSIAELMAERSSFSQGYDVGPEGRFGGQAKAKGLILDHPFGIGALQFGSQFHHEDVHNVYLSMFLNAGWLGGIVYFAIVALTMALGLAHIARATPWRPLYIVAYAALAGNVVEGIVIDTDHWRHFYLLLAIVWGLMSAKTATSVAEAR